MHIYPYQHTINHNISMHRYVKFKEVAPVLKPLKVTLALGYLPYHIIVKIIFGKHSDKCALIPFA